jgi:hypothetical protein
MDPGLHGKRAGSGVAAAHAMLENQSETMFRSIQKLFQIMDLTQLCGHDSG